MGTVSVEGEVAGTRGPTRAPLDRVVRLSGAGLRDLAESLDPLPPRAPAVLFFAPPDGSASHIVGAVLDAVENAALGLLPLCFPDGLPSDGSSLSRQAAKIRATALASTSEHFGPYLSYLAAARSSGRRRADAFARETRLLGAARVVAAANARDHAVVVLDISSGVDSSAAAAAAEWLCSNGIGIWLIGSGSEAIDRCPVHRATVPPAPHDVVTIVDRFRPLSYPPVVGHPHAASAPEKRLHRLLNTRDWATGRHHNHVVRLTPVSQPFTVDVAWPSEKVAVEIDGPEHRARQRFSDDRSRDNQLQNEGWTVLRFTNEDVMTDHERVVTTIRRAVLQRRKSDFA